jgi:hypothetical protein
MIGYSLSQRKSTTYDERIMEISLGLWWEGTILQSFGFIGACGLIPIYCDGKI